MDPDNAHRLQYLIETRHSSRVPFDPRWKVTEYELGRIVDAARWAPTAHNMQNFQLVVVEDDGVLDQLGRISAPVSPTFIVENYAQLSWSPEELARRKTGILGTMFPPSWWTADPELAPQGVARPLGETLAGAPMVIVVAFDPTQRAPASEGDVLGMISLGCLLENMWLAAHASRLDVQVVSAVATAERDVKDLLGIPAGLRIAFALRVGHAIASAGQPRVRRDPEMFVHRDRFRR